MGLNPSPPATTRTDLYGLDRDDLAELLERYEAPAFHARQIYAWLYGRGVHDPGRWTDLPLGLRERLGRETRVGVGRISGRTTAEDGTVKYRIALPAGGEIESVFMVQSGRVTLCLSSQVGCALDCDFCLTGKMGFKRHLGPGEIVGQVARIREDRRLGERPFSIVFMGMGEPLHNYDGVMAAFRLLTDPRGFALGRRRITVSTSGLAPAVERLAEEPVRPRLAVSLNATTDEVRSRLMPVNRKYPLRRLLEACRLYARSSGERFTFEYVLLSGINDRDDDIPRLARLAHGLPVKINLIPFNPVPGLLAYRPPTRNRVLEIRDGLLARKIPTSIRWSRGTAARAACGQLALDLPPHPADGGHGDDA
jgi:23S rRNA (adenine2503-C2)-methyltransferase